MRKFIHILLCALGLPSLCGCVRDEVPPCPPLQVSVAVKDKNYFNVAVAEKNGAAGEYRDENLPFREYVPTLSYTLRRAGDGEVVETRESFRVEGDTKEVELAFPDELPHGIYVLTVWGGEDGRTDRQTEDGLALLHHTDGTPGSDPYLVNDTLVYDAYTYRHRVEMERTKGKLVILSEELPPEVGRMEMHAGELWSRVDAPKFSYSGKTEVDDRLSWEGNPPLVVMKTLLSPSTGEKKTKVKTGYYNLPDGPAAAFLPETVDATLRRNELTLLRYVWKPGERGFDIFILINDTWTSVHEMEIN